MPLFYSWSFGPLLYGYMRAQAGQVVTLPHWLFAPVLVQFLFYLVLMAQPLDTKSWFWINVHKPYTRYIEYYVACGMVLYAIYRSRPYVTDRWPEYLLTGLSVFYILAIIDPIINEFYIPPYWPKFYLTTHILPFFVYALALIGLLYNHLQKAEKPTLSLPVTADQRQQVLTALQGQELYKDPDLTLSSLASSIGESPNVVSRIINAGFNQSFNEFVNSYRIEEIKRRMDAGDTERVTILALALDAGFASKTTFNRVFKEQTGHTPKEYLKKSQIIQRDDSEA